jgi:L-lactate dehydrogenase (cytochrome)
MRRQVPKVRDLAPLMRLKTPRWDRRAARLADAQTIWDLRRIAQRRTPRAAFDYTDGAAEAELSLARAREAFADIEFHPQILRDVADVDTTRTVLGGPSALPFAIAPTGFTRMMQTEGELAGARATITAGSIHPVWKRSGETSPRRTYARPHRRERRPSRCRP